MNLKTIYETYKEHFDSQPYKSNKKKKKERQTEERRVKSLIADTQLSTVQSHYPDCPDYVSLSVSSTQDENKDIVAKNKALQPVEMKSIETDLNEVMIDENRIVQPNAGLSGLYEFVPATKIKGNIHCN